MRLLGLYCGQWGLSRSLLGAGPAQATELTPPHPVPLPRPWLCFLSSSPAFFAQEIQVGSCGIGDYLGLNFLLPAMLTWLSPVFLLNVTLNDK